MQTLGLIGYGNFGQFFVKHLTPFFKICIYDSQYNQNIEKTEGLEFQNLETVSRQDIVVLAIPVQNMKDLLKKISPFIKPGSTIIDVSSVKIKTKQYMLKYLPKDSQLLGTHPLFGPQSGKNGIEGLRIVLCPIRINNFKIRINFFSKKLKLKTLIKTPEEHDKQMAYVQALTHYIALTLKKMDIQDYDQKTMSYEKLLELKELLKNESIDLYKTIQNQNPYAKTIRKKFKTMLDKIDYLHD